MKKQNYLAPEVEAVELRAENMICTSEIVQLGLTVEDEDDW